jgi:hypothetical protein
MLVFLDESGDAGRKPGHGSSHFFVVSLVTFTDPEVAAACDERINLLRRELSLPKNFEFHFYRNSHKQRLAFLDAVAPYEFFSHAFALNKDPAKLYGAGYHFKGPLYKNVCGMVFENARPYLEDAKVTIDKSGDRAFRNQLASYLRKRINVGQSRHIRKLRMEDSRTNNLLQLADYVAGVVNRRVSGKADSEQYYRVLAPRMLNVRIWPE